MRKILVGTNKKGKEFYFSYHKVNEKWVLEVTDKKGRELDRKREFSTPNAASNQIRLFCKKWNIE